MNNVDVVYTMWENLKKTQGMEVGQVGFHKAKQVLYLYYIWLYNIELFSLNGCHTHTQFAYFSFFLVI